jgi:hypothetical protein
VTQEPPAPPTFIGSAKDYRARSDSLLERARTEEPEFAAALEADALEWRKLAFVAEWQEAMLCALAAAERAGLRYPRP